MNISRLVTCSPRRLLAGIATAVLAAGSAEAATPSWTFYTVDFPNFATVTSPLTVNSKNQVTGYFDDADGNYHGYIGQLQPDGTVTMQQLDVPGATQTVAGTVNDNGDVVGAYWDANGFTHGFLLKKGKFATIDVPGAAQTNKFYFEFGKGLGTAMFGLNKAGDVVGTYATADNIAHGVLLHKGQFATIDVPGHKQTAGSQTEGTQINSFGHVIGGFYDHNCSTSRHCNSHGFLLRDGQFTIIDNPEAVASFGTITTGINDDGDIVGSYSGPTVAYNDFHGFALIDGQYIRIDIPGAVFSETFGINNNRIITGGYAAADGRIHGYIGIPNR